MKIWTEDDEETYTPKVKHTAVGRPVENPFESPEVEEEFARRGKAMIELYYKPSGPDTRKDFVFGPGRDMSKTLFWALVYIYYTRAVKQMKENLQGFLSAVQAHFGTDVASDRTSICRSVKMLEPLSVHNKHIGDLSGSAGERQKKYRSYYQYVIRRWEMCVQST